LHRYKIRGENDERINVTIVLFYSS